MRQYIECYYSIFRLKFCNKNDIIIIIIIIHHVYAEPIKYTFKHCARLWWNNQLVVVNHVLRVLCILRNRQPIITNIILFYLYYPSVIRILRYYVLLHYYYRH